MSRHLSPVPDWAQGVPVTDREADQERKLLDCANILGRLHATVNPRPGFIGLRTPEQQIDDVRDIVTDLQRVLFGGPVTL